jgi:flagellar hook protein FlgE
MSFQQGLSGLNATSHNLEVIGNNIANASTFGAKTSRAEFADMYAGLLNNTGTGTGNIGMGVQTATVAQQFTQGNISATENPMDVAINGSGFFQVQDTSGATVYTRNGQFKVDAQGFIVNNQGDKLLGPKSTPLSVPTAGVGPQATQTVGMTMNLDSRATPLGAGTPIDFADPAAYTSATSMSVYDGKGQDVPVTMYYRKTGADSWDVYASANGSSVLSAPAPAGNPLPIASISYSGNGSTATVTNNQLTPPATVASNAVPLDIPAVFAPGSTTNKLNEAVSITMDLSKSTQYGTSFGITALDVSGHAPGQMSSLSIDPNGKLMARYTNGKSLQAGQIELATFANPQGLQPLGGNAWGETVASGKPLAGVPKSGSLGQLQAGALEESNVDLTGELVNMITAQRIYQANAQTIKTEDAILQTLVNLR